MDYGLLILEILGYNHKNTIKQTSLSNERLLISGLNHFYTLFKYHISTYLTSGSTTKPQLSRQYGTGTKTEI